jgi:dolichyl-phosphate-mannose-protein mannosyltransferase
MDSQNKIETLDRVSDSTQGLVGLRASVAERQSTFPQLMSRGWKGSSKAREWLRQQLGHESHSRLTRTQVAMICATIFVSGVGVRLLHWQDKHVEIVSGKASLFGVFNRYEKEARRMLDSGGILFPRVSPANGDARMLVHPPGYSILLAAIHLLGGNPYTWLWVTQIVGDGAAALLVFLIALQLINWGVAFIAAMLVAVSPHLAYYSLILSPDSLAVLPLLIAIYFYIRAFKRTRLVNVIVAGVFIGLSCWLRANALLLAPLLAVITVALFPRAQRLGYSAALLGTAILVISPITIRNLSVFHHFIPVSIAAGENLVVGIGDYDTEQRFGMPRSDREARIKDVEWNGRADYAGSLWAPDGIERDRVRFARGVAVIRSNPGWFLGVMLRRAGFMLRYNDRGPHRWPLNTAVVPVVSLEPPFGHPVVADQDAEPTQVHSPTIVVLNGSVIPQSVALTDANLPAWSTSPNEIVATGTLLSSKAAISLAAEGKSLQILGDDSEYGDQFESVPIPVRRDTDYVLAIPARLIRGNMAIKITSIDRRIACALATMAEVEAPVKGTDMEAGEPSESPEMSVVQIPFASAKNSQVRLVLSNNGITASSPTLALGPPNLFELGATPYTSTRFPRVMVRGLQRNLFTTSRMLPAVILGIALLAFARRWAVLALILVVPVYYLVAQSALSTEYRYILGIHYFLFMSAGVTLYCFVAAATQLFKKTVMPLTWRFSADNG